MSSGNHNSSNGHSLSPFDFSNLGMGFGVYRPRRPSYTFATQQNRARSGSYRCATSKESPLNSSSDAGNIDDFIDDVLKHRRKRSYTCATKEDSSSSSKIQMPCLADNNDGMNSEDTTGTSSLIRNNVHVPLAGESECPDESEKTLTPVTEKSDSSCVVSIHGDYGTTAPTALKQGDKPDGRVCNYPLADRNGNGHSNTHSQINTSSKIHGDLQEKAGVNHVTTHLANTVPSYVNTNHNSDANVVARIHLTDMNNVNHNNNSASTIPRILPAPDQVLFSGDLARLEQTCAGYSVVSGVELSNGSAVLGGDTYNTRTHLSRQSCGSSSRGSARRGSRGGGCVAIKGGGVSGFRKTMTDTLRFNKNIVILSIGFILIFSSFQAIQNLQSSLNASNGLGTISMMVVHISMVIACLVAPSIINHLTAKWALCIGVTCFLLWFSANFYPKFYTLVPSAIFVGLGQGVLWGAESSYIQKLAFESAKVTKANVDGETFRFHGIFLACFQTTHIWGNLISSLWLSQQDGEDKASQPLAVDSNPDSGYASHSDPDNSYYDYYYDGGGRNLAQHQASHNTSVHRKRDGVHYDVNMASGSEMTVEEAPLMPSSCGALSRCDGPGTVIFFGGQNSKYENDGTLASFKRPDY